jgi:type II secretory pathway component PulF
VAVNVALPLGLWMLLLLSAIVLIAHFQELFDNLGVRLPVVTALILEAANVVRHRPIATLGVVAVLTVLDAWLDRSLAAAARHSLRRWLLGVRVAVPLGLLVLAIWGMLAPLLQLRANLP